MNWFFSILNMYVLISFPPIINIYSSFKFIIEWLDLGEGMDISLLNLSIISYPKIIYYFIIIFVSCWGCVWRILPWFRSCCLIKCVKKFLCAYSNDFVLKLSPVCFVDCVLSLICYGGFERKIFACFVWMIFFENFYDILLYPLSDDNRETPKRHDFYWCCQFIIF